MKRLLSTIPMLLLFCGCTPQGDNAGGSGDDVFVEKYQPVYSYPTNSLQPGDGEVLVSPVAISSCKDSKGNEVDVKLCGSPSNGPSIAQKSPPGYVIISPSTIKNGETVISVLEGETKEYASTLPERTSTRCSEKAAPSSNGTKCALKFKEVSSGTYHTCAIASDDKAYCWGAGFNGMLGTGTSNDSLTPVAAQMNGDLAGKTIKKISSGANFTCAIASDDKAYCWGGFQRFVSGVVTFFYSPIAVNTSGALDGKTVKQISTGVDRACVIAGNSGNDNDDQVYCWGDIGISPVPAQIGQDTGTDLGQKSPLQLTGSGITAGKTFKSVSVGKASSCAISSDGLGYCWGSGFLGHNSFNASLISPVVPVDNTLDLLGKSLKEIAVGENHACAIASDDRVYCWGSNTRSQVSGMDQQSYYPEKSRAFDDYPNLSLKKISTKGNHNCAIGSDERSYCWGANDRTQVIKTQDGSLGVSSPIAFDALSQVSSNEIMTTISAGEKHTCAISLGGALYCWGDNTYGQLGSGLITPKEAPLLTLPGQLE